MTDDRLPFGPAAGYSRGPRRSHSFVVTTAIGEIAPDLPPPPSRVQPLPRPRDDEPKPFTARRAPEWLVAYA